MNRPSTAREALIAEAIGEVAQLLDRVEALAPAMDEARKSLVQASAELAGQVVALENRIATITQNAKAKTVEHMVRRTDEVARQSLEVQTRAMAEAARAIFNAEVEPTLRRLVMPLQRVAQGVDRRWDRWLMHAATAVAASAATWALAAYLWAP